MEHVEEIENAPAAETGNWSGPPDVASHGSDSEDYFDSASFNSSDADYFFSTRLDSLDDVAAAIESCKQSILETKENTSGRKAMVNRLIQLRIRQEDLKERPQVSYETCGHTFVSYHEATGPIPGVSDVRRPLYCQQCGSNIWVHLQSAQFCTGCGFSVHSGCMDHIMRTCVAIKVRTQPDFIMDICPERVLPHLKYRCVECDVKFSRKDPNREPRMCDYTGLSFCPRCHWNATAATPARIVHNWDFEPRPVSQATKQYLLLMQRKPVINIDAINPKLFAIVQELVEVAEHRANIMLMKKYLTVCRIASEEKLLLHLISRQHFVDSSHLYSLQDLMDVKSGALTNFLNRVTDLFKDHIHNCVLCQAKGFICEICKDGTDVIFPFDKLATVCPKCEGGFHRQCFKQLEAQCPRCQRIKVKKESKKKKVEQTD